MCEHNMFFYGFIVGVLLCIGIATIILLLKVIRLLERTVIEVDTEL